MKRTPRQVYEEEILDMPPGIERAVLRVIGYHIGEENAIEKPALAGELNALGFGKSVKYSTFERQIRKAVNTLRKQGMLICSSSGDAGYFIARDKTEYLTFKDRELTPRITDLLEIRSAMDAGADTAFGEAVQMGLF